MSGHLLFMLLLAFSYHAAKKKEEEHCASLPIQPRRLPVRERNAP